MSHKVCKIQSQGWNKYCLNTVRWIWVRKNLRVEDWIVEEWVMDLKWMSSKWERLCIKLEVEVAWGDDCLIIFYRTSCEYHHFTIEFILFTTYDIWNALTAYLTSLYPLYYNIIILSSLLSFNPLFSSFNSYK